MTKITLPDLKKAKSIIEAAKRDIDFTLKIEQSENAGATIIRNIYESFRMLGDALLVAKGLKSEDHSSQLKELTFLNTKASRPIGVLENLKRIRHNINYHGYFPTKLDVLDAINIAKSLFEPLRKATLQKLSS